MKKSFIYALSALMLASMSACSNDEPLIDEVQDGDEVFVNLNISIPEGLQSRAFNPNPTTVGNGEAVRQLHYTIRENDTQTIIYDDVVSDAFASSTSTTLNVKLLVGARYDVALWADAEDGKTPYDYEKGKVTVTHSNPSGWLTDGNEEIYDAFYYASDYYYPISVNSSNPSITLTMKRPFAQVNIAASEEDYFAAQQILQSNNADYQILKSGMQVVLGSGTKVAQEFDIFSNQLKNSDYAAVYGYNYIPGKSAGNEDADPQILTVNGVDYALIATAYVFAPVNKTVTNYVEYIWGPNEQYLRGRKFENIPIQRNYRTNIVGNVLSTDASFTINLDPIFTNDYNETRAANPNIFDGTLYYNEVESSGYGKIYNMGGGDILIENKRVIFSMKNYGGLNGANKITFKNCEIQGSMFGYTDLEFEDCTFVGNTGISANKIYPIWTYGSRNVTFKNCLFNSYYSRAILVYSDLNLQDINVNVENCTFNATSNYFVHSGKAAVEIHTETGIGGTINIVNSSANAVYSGGLWNEWNNNTETPTDNFTIKVNGNIVQQGSI